MMVRDPKTRIGLTQLRDLPYIKSLEVNSSSASNADIPAGSSAAVDANAHAMDDANHISDEGMDLDSDDWDSPTQQIKTLNAFDLLTQCGGFCLDRLFSPQLYATIKDGPIADSLSDAIGGNIRYAGNSSTPQLSKYNFSSNCSDPRELIALAHNALVSLGCECVQTVEQATQIGAIRACKSTSKGQIGIGIRAFCVCSSMSLLEVRRGKGSLFEWCLLFQQLVDDKLKDVLLRPNTDGEAKEASA
jgi:hypothetical protein